ncbi:hypothetical protein F401_gp18 [Aeromonas phage phiAS7]|uniref:Uncharacterized protein n=1 Tax=Aeromonas phage phiAS7 TaxID=1141132 RepID=H6UK25_9CAUD|nr:hypothetical protein F401_gp18 [Aeromonas phage phiAS7]AEZ65043.1 hypothetical protein phiAS7_00018 [Aeromonas phage phiAS7]
MEQTIEIELGLDELAQFIASLYRQGLAYRFDALRNGAYRFTITGF